MVVGSGSALHFAVAVSSSPCCGTPVIAGPSTITGALSAVAAAGASNESAIKSPQAPKAAGRAIDFPPPYPGAILCASRPCVQVAPHPDGGVGRICDLVSAPGRSNELARGARDESA